MSRSTRRATAQANTLFEVEPVKGTVKVGDKVTGFVEGKESRIVAVPDPKPAKAKKTEVAKLVEAAPAKTLMDTLFGAITDPRVEVAKMDSLVSIRDKLMREQAHVEFITAYHAMREELPRITRDGLLDQGETKSGKRGVKARFASYENIHDAVAPVLRKHKMSIIAIPDVPTEGVGILVRGSLSYVCTTDYGKMVYSKECVFPLPPDNTGGKSPPQGIGSTMKYGFRYAYIALLGIVSHAPEDADDLDKGRSVKEPPKTISADELTKLKQAIDFCGSTPEEFCPFYKIAKLEDLPHAQFAEAMDACRRRAEGAKPKGNAGG